MKTIRCFLAINLELKTAKKISELQQQMISDSKEFESKIRWVPPQNMHITVRFLGNITEPMIQAIKDNLEPIANNSVPFTIHTGGLSTFDANDLRILYAAIIDEENGLATLVERTHEVLVNTGFKEVEKPFTPHVTLARIKDAVKEEIEGLLHIHQSDTCGSTLVRDLVCYQSTISKTGVDYKLLWKLPLLKKAPLKESPKESNRSTKNDDNDETIPNIDERPAVLDSSNAIVDAPSASEVDEEIQDLGEQ